LSSNVEIGGGAYLSTSDGSNFGKILLLTALAPGVRRRREVFFLVVEADFTLPGLF